MTPNDSTPDDFTPNDGTPDEFDALLRASLARRPDEAPSESPAQLAARVIARAVKQNHAAQATPVRAAPSGQTIQPARSPFSSSRVRLWLNRAAVAAAAVAVVVLIGSGLTRVTAIEAQRVGFYESWSSSTSLSLMTLGLLLAVVGVTYSVLAGTADEAS